jgi:hypothetical protein
MFSNFLLTKLNNLYFGRLAWTRPTTLYFAALTTGPTDNDGTGAVECTGSGYARVAVAASDANFGDIDGGGALANGRSLLYGMTNKNQISWGTASGDWGQITDLAIYTASKGGNLLAVIPLEAVINLPANATLYFAAETLRFTCSGGFMPALGDKILNWLFRGVTLGAPTNFYLALGNGLTLSIDENSTGTADDEMPLVFTELTGNGYARKAIPNTAARWPTATDGEKTLAGATLNFPNPVNTADWDTVTNWVLFDASTSGNALVGGLLDAPVDAVVSDVVQIPAGAIKINFSVQ